MHATFDHFRSNVTDTCTPYDTGPGVVATASGLASSDAVAPPAPAALVIRAYTIYGDADSSCSGITLDEIVRTAPSPAPAALASRVASARARASASTASFACSG